MSPHLSGLNDQLAPLGAGTPAPDFVLPQTRATRIALHSFLGQPVVLIFYPMDWEPVSREQLTLYQTYADAFAQLAARLLAISSDHLYSHQAFAREAYVSFPLLADVQPRGLVARRYGVFREAEGVSARALFVLDARGVIRFSKAYPEALNPGVDKVLTTLERLEAEHHGPGDEAARGR